MITTLNAIAPVFLIIATGYLLFRFRVVGESVWSAIEHICFYLLMPALIIRTLSRANLNNLPVVDFVLVLLVAILGMSAILVSTYALIWRRYPQSGPSFSSIFQGATRFHGFVAIAVIGPLYGDAGLALGALALAVMVPLLNVISVIVLSVYGNSDTRPDFASVARKVISNPLIIACLIGLLLNYAGVPDILFDSIEIIGAGGLGLALLAVGASMKLGQAARHKVLIIIGVSTGAGAMLLTVIPYSPSSAAMILVNISTPPLATVYAPRPVIARCPFTEEILIMRPLRAFPSGRSSSPRQLSTPPRPSP